MEDADREGDSELAEFFRRAQETSRKGAEQGKEIPLAEAPKVKPEGAAPAKTIVSEFDDDREDFL